MDFLKDLLRHYAGPAASAAAVDRDPATVENDFDQVASAGDRDDIAEGLAAAFRSDQTPPFPSMLGQLFGRSPATQRASILNTLIGVLGPALLSQILARRGLGDLLGGGRKTQVEPQEAERVPDDVIQEAAREAEKKDPSIVDRLSRIYAEQPQLVKTLGAAALAIAMARVAQRKGAR